jgi:hypothetical protein
MSSKQMIEHFTRLIVHNLWGIPSRKGAAETH